MPLEPESAAQAAHVLLDMLVAHDDNTDEETNVAAITVAFERLQEINAVTGTQDDDGVVTLDITPLLNAYGFTQEVVIQALADKYEIGRLDVIANLRAQID